MSTIMNFKNAFDSVCGVVKNISNLVVGENGSLQQQTVANSELDFDGILCEYFLLMRGSTETQVTDILDRLINILESKLLSEEKRKENLIKLLKISLFIREPRKGKGEKQVFYYIVQYLFNHTNEYKQMAKIMLDYIGEFGYYKDYNNIYENMDNPELRDYIITKYVEQLVKDINEQNVNKLSLCAKWSPRENSKYDKMSKNLAQSLINKINPQNTNSFGILKQYRQILSQLNKKLNTVQTYMCQKHWADIDFKTVPSVSMSNLSKAFQDEVVNPFPKDKRKTISRSSKRRLVKIDNRRHAPSEPDYEDRNKCRENLLNHIRNGGKVNSTVTNLSDIIDRYLRGVIYDPIWETQWENRVNEIRTFISTLSDKSSIFPMVDLSSSMSGSPMINAITLGLFTSMILDNPLDQEEGLFANRFMSFASTPQLVKLPRFSTLDNTKPASLKEKIEIMREWTSGGRWGGSTNIHAAIDLLLNLAIEHKVDNSQMPKILAIFSDMQFDQGDSSWNKTSYDNICDKFTKAGYTVPHVLFWNLRSNTVGFQVKADTPNSSMLSGYSTRMLDLFLSNNLNELNNSSESNEQNKKNTTLTLVYKALEHDIFEKYKDIFDGLF
jgi:hypothetical protein